MRRTLLFTRCHFGSHFFLVSFSQSFLEPWQDGTLSDQGAMSGGSAGISQSSSSSVGGYKIDCSQSIWILTSNWGQREIIDFYEAHKNRMHTKTIQEKDVAWIQKELVKKKLRPLVSREFRSVHRDIEALCRRIDLIVPFVPFSEKERNVVADIALIDRFSLYREPCILSGPEEERRSYGNLYLRGTKAFSKYAGSCYEPMQGASGMLSAVQQADGKFQMLMLRDHLGLTEEQKKRLKNQEPDSCCEEPSFWVHFDTEVEQICISQSRPPDDLDDDSSQDSFDSSGRAATGGADEDSGVEEDDGVKISSSRRSINASDDAF